MASRHRCTSQPTASKAARARSAGPCDRVQADHVDPASGRHQGARAPSSQGVATTPRAPGGLWAGPRGQLVGRWPGQRRAIHDKRDPAADSPPSSSQPPSAARDSTIPVGTGSGRSATGTDTLAVVPQLTMGQDSVAPEPSTSQGAVARADHHRRARGRARGPRPTRGRAVPVTRSDGDDRGQP